MKQGQINTLLSILGILLVYSDNRLIEHPLEYKTLILIIRFSLGFIFGYLAATSYKLK